MSDKPIHNVPTLRDILHDPATLQRHVHEVLGDQRKCVGQEVKHEVFFVDPPRRGKFPGRGDPFTLTTSGVMTHRTPEETKLREALRDVMHFIGDEHSDNKGIKEWWAKHHDVLVGIPRPGH